MSVQRRGTLPTASKASEARQRILQQKDGYISQVVAQRNCIGWA